ncbi:MAG: hypothetical protein QOJ96_2179 [Alphaproteobacteria bacterium]|jgi:hypothetical protein|nr:hypothetical protein [Alphaproteobacteria bacterium]
MDAADEDESDGRSRWRRLLTPPLLRRPKDVVGLGLISAAIGVIVINALFLQSGPHPAPIFANLPSPAASAELTSSVRTVLPRARPAEFDRSGAEKPKTVSLPTANRHDPIAELLDPSIRVRAVQRVLAEFGYGQITPTGTSDPETKAAIEKFERERKLPVTGLVSERLVRQLALMKGEPL